MANTECKHRVGASVTEVKGSAGKQGFGYFAGKDKTPRKPCQVLVDRLDPMPFCPEANEQLTDEQCSIAQESH